MNKRGNLQNVGYPVFFTPSAIAKLSFICDGEVTKSPTLNYQLRTLIVYHAPQNNPLTSFALRGGNVISC